MKFFQGEGFMPVAGFPRAEVTAAEIKESTWQWLDLFPVLAGEFGAGLPSSCQKRPHGEPLNRLVIRK